MNKQEAIEQINYMDTLNINDKAACQQVDMVIKNQVLDIINQIDEPQKPKVPQFVADWYEENKDYFEDKVYDLCVQFNFDESELNSDVAEWFGHSKSKPFETLVKMKLYGYEVEKEKLYRAKNRHTGEYLCYCFKFYHDKNSSSENQRFTAEEKRWKELGYWGNDLYVFEEAEGEDE